MASFSIVFIRLEVQLHAGSAIIDILLDESKLWLEIVSEVS